MNRRTSYLILATIVIVTVAPLVIPLAKPLHDHFELGFFVAQTVLAVIALFALVYAHDQVKEAQTARDHLRDQVTAAQEARLATLSVAKANFMLEMDRRWDSPELSTGFSKYYRMKNDTVTPEKFTEAVEALMLSNIDEYRKLSNVLGFFETVGVMIKRGYIDEDDMDALFGGAIVDAGTRLRPHVEARQADAYKKGMPKGLFDNALFLVDRMVALDAKRSAGTH